MTHFIIFKAWEQNTLVRQKSLQNADISCTLLSCSSLSKVGTIKRSWQTTAETVLQRLYDFRLNFYIIHAQFIVIKKLPLRSRSANSAYVSKLNVVQSQGTNTPAKQILHAEKTKVTSWDVVIISADKS